MPNNKKKYSRKEIITMKLRKLWRKHGYHKYMPFGSFRILYNTRKYIRDKCT